MALKIKLVIWDLDNTLWHGTLAEGDAPALIPERAKIIKDLTVSGVVNSICSKNNFEQAKKVLVEMGLWGFFVFPKIDFAPKGQMIQSILDEMHLRAVNTIFIDDQVANLREALYYNPEINVLRESNCELFFNCLISSIEGGHSRLEQYKQLEEKTAAKKTFSSNEDFLRNSDIRLEILPVSNRALFDRLCELTERTNQLNFTKNRMSPDELLTLLKDPNIETRLIRATDNFGDYGLIGFYSLYQRNLIHFVFSCRIINMGIEHFVYQYLGYPKVKVEGVTASQLSQDTRIDYIKIVNGSLREFAEESIEKVLTEESQVNIFALGACDLYHPIAHFSLPNNYFLYECNVFVGNERGVNVGTEYIRSQYDMTVDEKNFCRRHFYNYTRSNVFKSNIFDDIWDYAIISFHDDMIYQVYENKKNPNLRVVLSPDRKFGSTSVINISDGKPASYEQQRAWLKDNFNGGHYITPERFEENLLWIAAQVPEKTKIILINGPVLDFFRSYLPHCPEARQQILALNEVIARVCNAHREKFIFVDINKVIRSRDDVTDYVFHLKAQTAFNLFIEIADAIKRNNTTPPPYYIQKPCMLHKVLNGREVCIFGKKPSELMVAYYDLLLGGVKVSACVYHKPDEVKTSEIKNLELDVLDFKQCTFKSDKCYIVIADNDNYTEIRELLIKNGYTPLKDFVQFKSVPYRGIWQDKEKLFDN